MSATVPRIVAVEEDQVAAAVTYVANAQADPARHVTFVGMEAETILEEFAEADSWLERLLVAHVDDDVAGVLLADIDPDMRRVWWIGPWATDTEVSVGLMTEARARFGHLFDQEELAPDSRNTELREIAGRLGFVEGTWSSVLEKSGLEADEGRSSEPLTPGHAEAVAALHDSIFPGTHTPGARLVTADRTRIRTVEIDGEVAGYVAYEVQADGTGYVDFLGVAPSARRRGLARALVEDACRELAAEGVSSMHLTVRVDAPGAVDLYRSLGFVEERLIVPCRSGFTLD